MATKKHILAGSDCFGEEMELELSRSRNKVTVLTADQERFCCKYDDLVEIVNKLAPKPKAEKQEEADNDNGTGESEGIALPTDGVT